MTKETKTRRKHKNTAQALANGICAKRKSKGISQYKLADRTGLARNSIQQIECYEHLPMLETILEVMLELDFSKEESGNLVWECLNAYRKDMDEQQGQEQEMAGVL